MYLFGGKFCKFTDETSGQERECTCPEIIGKHPLCECDRKHFNNILWATVTVFQVSHICYFNKFFVSSSLSLIGKVKLEKMRINQNTSISFKLFEIRI